MTTPTQMPESLKVPAELASIQQALDAGPTAGLWRTSVGACYDQVEVENGPLICFAAIREESKTNARLIAASGPVTWTAVLSHISALQSALKDRDAEIERLKKDAERYRWIKSDDAAQFRIIELSWSTYLWDSKIDAAIDSMKGDAT